MRTFQVKAKTASGSLIGNYIIDIYSDDPLEEGDILTITQELGNE